MKATTEKETIYLPYHIMVATEKAIKEFAKEGFVFDSLKLFNNGEGKGSWIEVEPTHAKDLFRLGLKAASFL
jgi:hypothetical protein